MIPPDYQKTLFQKQAEKQITRVLKKNLIKHQVTFANPGGVDTVFLLIYLSAHDLKKRYRMLAIWQPHRGDIIWWDGGSRVRFRGVGWYIEHLWVGFGARKM
jgi:hypothetical protein